MIAINRTPVGRSSGRKPKTGFVLREELFDSGLVEGKRPDLGNLAIGYVCYPYAGRI